VKKFLTLTAFLEGLTAISLIAFPKRIILFLLGQPSNESGWVITIMLAGAAILSLAVICWLLRETISPQKLVIGMLFYNCAIIAVALFGAIGFGLTGPGLWLMILLHTGLSLWGATTLSTK
jgi:hypothetical protein